MEHQADSVLPLEKSTPQPEQGWSLVPQAQGGDMSSLSISASSGSTPQIDQSQMSKIAQMKSLFDQLGKDLQSGNLSAAKSDYAAIKKNAPQGASQSDNGPMAQMQSKMDQLGQALDSGDLAAAKTAYSDIQQSAPKGGPKGAPPAGGGASPSAGATTSASGGKSSSSSTSTDSRDLNGDGVVSAAEILIYSIMHPDLSKKDSDGTKAPEKAQETNTTQADLKVDTYA
jgi:hypothetical protein